MTISPLSELDRAEWEMLHGFPRLYWNTEVDADARALYDKVANYRGYIVYNYTRPTVTNPA